MFKKKMIFFTDGEQKKFSILTNPSATLSAKDTNLTITDKLSDVFPVGKIVAGASSAQVAEQAAGEGAKTTQPAIAAAEPVKPPQKTWKANYRCRRNSSKWKYRCNYRYFKRWLCK